VHELKHGDLTFTVVADMKHCAQVSSGLGQFSNTETSQLKPVPDGLTLTHPSIKGAGTLNTDSDFPHWHDADPDC